MAAAVMKSHCGGARKQFRTSESGVGEKAHDAKKNEKPQSSPRSGSQSPPTCHTFFVRPVRLSRPTCDHLFVSRNGVTPVSLLQKLPGADEQRDEQEVEEARQTVG
jgi:hypothetical protein